MFEALGVLMEDHEFPIKPYMLARSPCLQLCASFVSPATPE